MNWKEKIEILLRDRSAAKLERIMGLPTNRLRTSVNTLKTAPNAVRGVKMAHALGVTSDWLFDDSQDWPPPLYAGGLVPPDSPQLHAISWAKLQIEESTRESAEPEIPKAKKPRRRG